jgi:transposase-like protein
VAWCIDSDGRKHLLHLAVGNKESEACWTGFFRSMLERSLRMPTTATSDGAPGLIRAIEVCFPAEYPDSVLVSLCRPQDYADVEPDSLVGQGFRAGEVGIIR